MKKEHVEKVSVIIPIYNAKEYMQQCISSIQSQSHENLEILLIDDGSSDGSNIMCDKFAKEDSRIKVIHKENEGPASARNYGMQMATGDFLCFVDSDDYLEQYAIEKMLNAMDETIDIVQCRSKKIYNYSRVDLDKWISEEKTLSKIEAMKDYLLNPQPTIRFSVWAKLIRRSITETISFPNIKNGEDVVFNVYLIDQCQNVKYIPEILYFYTVRESSLSQTGLNEQRIQNALHRDKCIREFIESRSLYVELLPRVCWVQVLTIIMLSCRVCKKQEDGWEKVVKDLRQKLCEISIPKNSLHFYQHLIMKCYKMFPLTFVRITKKII